MIACKVLTPTDFSRIVAAESYSVDNWVSATGALEAKTRAAVSGIFDDLPYIDIHEPQSLSLYLNGIEAPLKKLASLNIQLLAIQTKGRYTVPAKRQTPARVVENWRNTRYIIAPDPAFFRVQMPGESAPVHLLSTECLEAIQTVVTQGDRSLTVFPSMKLLCGYFEDNVPWCPQCLLLAARYLPERSAVEKQPIEKPSSGEASAGPPAE